MILYTLLLYDAIYAPCRTSYVTAGGLRILENKNKREKEAKKQKTDLVACVFIMNYVCATHISLVWE